MRQETLLTAIPFSGFYYSLHADQLDQALAQVFDLSGCGSPNDDLLHNAIGVIDWVSVHEAYAKEYVDAMGSEYGLTLAFEGLTSPRYYNFETDRIFAHITRDSLAKVWRAVPRHELRKAIRERFTSRDGFISNYPASLSDWPAALSDWDCNQIGTLISVYLDQESAGYGASGFDQFKEYDLMEGAQGNGLFENWLFEFSERGREGELNRLCSINEYLQARSEREVAA